MDTTLIIAKTFHNEVKSMRARGLLRIDTLKEKIKVGMVGG